MRICDLDHTTNVCLFKSMMHVGRGREHPLHIEYVHIGACLSFIQDTLTEALLSHPRLRLEKKVALVKALGKVIWIQNDLFAKWWYVLINSLDDIIF